jgi:DNA-binding CsgD family transcriptional regulator
MDTSNGKSPHANPRVSLTEANGAETSEAAAGRAPSTVDRPPPQETGTSPLTKRESQIVALIAEGKTTKEIACTLEPSPETVGTHRKNICRKMNFHSTAELVSFSVRRFQQYQVLTSSG